MARFPHVSALLQSTDADVLVLQEVTQPFVRHLLKQPWVREGYWCSDTDAAITVTPYGQLVLCKRPMAVSFVRFSQQKTAVLASLRVGALWVGVAAVHLTSNYHDGTATDGADGVTTWAQQRREAQLAVLLDALRVYPCALVAGDFNYDPERDSPDPEGLRAYTDAWTALRPGQEGLTFDAAVNPTAAITSKTAKRRRYDRVCVRGAQPAAVRVLGTQRCVAGRLCPSDHYAVAAHLTLPGGPARRHYATVDALLHAQARAVGDAAAEVARRQAVAAQLAGWLGVPVTAVGSTALGAVLRDGDVDCIADVELSAAHARLAAAGVALEPFTDPTVLRALVDGVQVDLGTRGDGDGERDAAAVLEAWGERSAACATALRFLKLWAARAGVYGNVYGYPNGLALAVLLARAARAHPQAHTAHELVRAFFAFFADYDWSQPVCVAPGQRYRARAVDPLPIGTPAGGHSIVRNATASSVAVWARAVREAAQLVDEPAAMLLQWRDPLGRPDVGQQYPCYVQAELLSEVRATQARVVALVIALEQAVPGLRCHVYGQLLCSEDGGDTACVLIGLSQEVDALPVQLDDAHMRCALVHFPLCHRPYRLREAAVVAPVAAAAADEEEAAAEPQEEPDFAAMAAGCRSSDEVYKMLKWHPAFEGAKDSEIGWEDRFLGLIRKVAWSSGGWLCCLTGSSRR